MKDKKRWKRRYVISEALCFSSSRSLEYKLTPAVPFQPFETGEKVLVESKSGKLLWDATVKEVSQEREDGPVTGYKVEYKGWGERFDEWVVPSRLVEPSENNRQVQVS
jgi:hypothetical protein